MIEKIIRADTEHFDYYTDKACIDNRTGEERKTEDIIVRAPADEPVQIIVMTEAQKEERNKRKEQEQYRRKENRFIFVSCRGFEDINAETLARLVLLGTFLDRDTGAITRAGKAITVDDLSKLLNISKRSVRGFIKNTQDKYLFVSKAKEITMNTQFIKRGSIGSGGEYRKVYTSQYRGLYNKQSTGNQKYIGFMLKCLRFTNVKYNVLCENTSEGDINYIEPLSFKQLANYLGADTTHIKRFVSQLENISFNGRDGDTHNLFTFTEEATGKEVVYIDNEITYSGELDGLYLSIKLQELI